MACAPSEDSNQPRQPRCLIRIFAVNMKKAWVLSHPLSTQHRLWLDQQNGMWAQRRLKTFEAFCTLCHTFIFLLKDGKTAQNINFVLVSLELWVERCVAGLPCTSWTDNLLLISSYIYPQSLYCFFTISYFSLNCPFTDWASSRENLSSGFSTR